MKKNYTFTIETELQGKFKESCIKKDVSMSERLEMLMEKDIKNDVDRLDLIESKVNKLIKDLSLTTEKDGVKEDF